MAGVFLVSTASASPDFDIAIIAAQEFRAGDGREAMGIILDDLDESLSPPNDEAIGRLVSASFVPELPPEFALRLFDLASSKCDSRSSVVLIETVASEALRSLDRSVSDQAAFSAGNRIARRLFSLMKDEPWSRWAAQTPASVELIAFVTTGEATGLSLVAWGDAIEALDALPIESESKSDLALDIILTRLDTAENDSRLLNMLDVRARDVLFGIVQEKSGQPVDLPVGAVHALAYLGDARLLDQLPLIEAAARQSEEARASRMVRGLPRTTLRWAAMVRSQQSEQAMLDFLETFDQSLDYQVHEWAMYRAVELGIDGQLIRRAIIRYEQANRPLLRGDGLENRHYRMHITTIKRWGLRSGILRESDLPHVSIPDAWPKIPQ